MTQPTRLPAPGSGQPQNLSPIDWWAIGQGVGAIGSMLDQRRHDRAARQWQDRLDAAQSAFLTDRRVKLAEVATPAEMTAYDDMMGRAEHSYAEMRLYDDLYRRWCDENPTEYPSQDQHRQGGHLCRCDPNRGHACSAQAIANDPNWMPPASSTEGRPGGLLLTAPRPPRAPKPWQYTNVLRWLPTALTLISMAIAAAAGEPGSDADWFSVVGWLLLAASAVWAYFVKARRAVLEPALRAFVDRWAARWDARMDQRR